MDTDTPSSGHKWGRWIFVTLCVTAVVIKGTLLVHEHFGSTASSDDSTNELGTVAFHDRCSISKGRPKMQPVAVRAGHLITLRIQVIRGDPVNVRIGWVETQEEKKAIIVHGVKFPEAQGVKEWSMGWEEWPVDKPATVLLDSEGNSEVALEVRRK
jgi:hypothetical protein